MQRAETQIGIASLTAGIHAAVVLGDFDTAFVLTGHLQSVVTIDLEHRRVSRAYFLRMDLLFPKEAPYWKVLQANTEGGYWQLVRTSKPMFDLICSKWNPDKVLWRDGYAEDAAGGMVPRRGRPNMLDARGVCALTLAWLGSTGPNNRLLEQIFEKKRSFHRAPERGYPHSSMKPATLPQVVAVKGTPCGRGREGGAGEGYATAVR